MNAREKYMQHQFPLKEGRLSEPSNFEGAPLKGGAEFFSRLID
jgi:hypothetical protein